MGLPGLVVAALAFDKVEGNTIVRLLTAGFLGAALQVLGTFAYGVIQAGVVRLLGEEMDYDAVYEPRSYISGLLITVIMWAWWQYDRDRVVDEIASCMSHEAYEARSVELRGLVMQCYEATRAADDDTRE